MKSCKNCNQLFEPKHATRGHEQLYCSIKCRNEAYKKRVNEKQQTESESIGDMAGRESGVLQYRSPNNPDVIGLLEKLGDTKTEVVRYQLKCESLEKENEQLKIKLNNLEAELDAIDEDDDTDESSIGGVVSGVLNNFKQDPVTAINFASALIEKLFSKPTANAKATTTQKSS